MVWNRIKCEVINGILCLYHQLVSIYKFRVFFPTFLLLAEKEIKEWNAQPKYRNIIQE